MSDVVVIGAGAFGTWTAHHLSNAGARVALVDAYGPGNSRSSSGDESRILRYGYGTDEIYSRLARRSREQWRELDARNGSGLSLWHPCGVLWLAPEGDAYAADTRATLEGGDYPLELLDRATLRARYPHIDADDIGTAMLEPEGGVIMARRSIQALASELTRKGVRVRRGRVATAVCTRASLRGATGKRDDTRWRRIRIRVRGLAAIGIPGAPRSANHAYASSGHVFRHLRWRRSVQRTTHARMD